jgi:hypothetical protein
LGFGCVLLWCLLIKEVASRVERIFDLPFRCRVCFIYWKGLKL